MLVSGACVVGVMCMRIVLRILIIAEAKTRTNAHKNFLYSANHISAYRFIQNILLHYGTYMFIVRSITPTWCSKFSKCASFSYFTVSCPRFHRVPLYSSSNA